MGMMEKLMRLMAEKKASDLYIAANAPVLIRIDGVCRPVTPQLLPNDAPYQLLAEAVTPQQLAEFDRCNELNIAVPLAGVGRFRFSAMRQRSSCAQQRLEHGAPQRRRLCAVAASVALPLQRTTAAAVRPAWRCTTRTRGCATT